MRSPGLLVVASCLAVSAIGCGGLTIRYEPREPVPVRGAALVTVLDVECDDAMAYAASCRYRGMPVGGKVLGVFHIPRKAYRRWTLYRDKVVDMAQAEHCPAVAVRIELPSNKTQEEPIGALCLDPTRPEGPPGVPAPGMVVVMPPQGTVVVGPAPAR